MASIRKKSNGMWLAQVRRVRHEPQSRQRNGEGNARKSRAPSD